MIEFSGEFSEKSKKFLLKKNATVGFVSSFAAALLIGIIAAFILKGLWLVLLYCVLLCVIILTTIAPYIEKEKNLKHLIPKKIIIMDNGDVILHYNNFSLSKGKNSFSKIICYEEIYYLKLSFPKVDGFICQKNLLTLGTIEDFERIFEDKIVRKAK